MYLESIPSIDGTVPMQPIDNDDGTTSLKLPSHNNRVSELSSPILVYSVNEPPFFAEYII